MKITELQYMDEYPNMTLRGCMILIALRDHDMDFSEIARTISINKAALTRSLDMLASYELVKRTRQEYDARKVRIDLTNTGRRVVGFIT